MMAQSVITSFNQSGAMVCSNLMAVSTITVQWTTNSLASSNVTWSALSTNTAGTNGMLQVNATLNHNNPPTFYRLVQSEPAGMAVIPAGSFTMGDTIDGNQYRDAAPTIIHVSAFFMDQTLVPYGLWTSVYNYATNHGFVFTTIPLKAREPIIR